MKCRDTIACDIMKCTSVKFYFKTRQTPRECCNMLHQVHKNSTLLKGNAHKDNERVLLTVVTNGNQCNVNSELSS